jgi:hypothetical protein
MRGSSDRAPVAVTQRGEADVDATTSNAIRRPRARTGVAFVVAASV